MRRSNAIQQYNEQRFRRQVDEALSKVQKILSTTRHPTYAEDCDHEYEDKYELAEFLTNAALASHMNVLERLGLDKAKLSELRTIAVEKKIPVSLRFEGSRACKFVAERKVKVDNPTEFVTEAVEKKKKDEGAEKEKTVSVKHKVVREVTEYVWRVDVQYSVFAYAGSEPEHDRVLLQSRASHKDVVTAGTKESPFPSSETLGPFDATLTWMLENVAADGEDNKCSFLIDRSAESCRTPRRNDNVKDAFEFFSGVQNWSERVQKMLLQIDATLNSNRPGQDAPSKEPEARVHLNSITGEGVFVPVLPLFEDPSTQEADAKQSPLLSVADSDAFLSEQIRSIDGKISKLAESFPSSDSDKVVSTAEAVLCLLSLHTNNIVSHYFDGVGYIEEMLRKQLIAAIGKTIQENDFSEYVRFHDSKLFKSEYMPTPFCYAIRRPNHYPDGVLSIEQEDANAKYEPVMTLSRHLGRATSPTYLPINAAVDVELTGERYLHAWILHRFAGRQAGNFKLIARARQFSSFMLILGKISGPDSFEATDAIILQNKDELLVPLLLNQLPSPKEFKDAISSLSPEQKRFATAFRNMQLESSVFGVCCIQLKPQLELLLGLPSDALTKEVRLTQDLLSLFIDYQIPSDLLSFDGSTDMSSTEKVGVVKGHAKNVMEMIESSKERDLRAAEQEADMAFELRQAEAQVASCDSGSTSFASFGGPPQNEMTMLGDRGGGGRRGGGGGGGAYRSVGIGSSNVERGGRPNQFRTKTMQRSMPPPPPSAPVFKSAMRAPQPEAMTVECMSVTPSAPPRATEKQILSTAQDSSLRQSTTESAKGSDVIKGIRGKDVTEVDFTQIPKQLDAKFEKLDEESALRATTIKTADSWKKKSQKNLLARLEEKGLGTEGRKSERDKAFDLLDALSRSGSLPISCAELHVIVCATHCFDRTVMDTVIVDNVNPIEKMERSSLIVASAIHGVSPGEMMKDEEKARVKKYSPILFAASSHS